MQLTMVDWLVIVAYFGVNLLIGFYYARKAGSSVDEFFISGREVAWWLAGTILVKHGRYQDGIEKLREAQRLFLEVENADGYARVELDVAEADLRNGADLRSVRDRLSAVAAYAIEKRLPIEQCKALAFLRELGTSMCVGDVVYVRDFIDSSSAEPYLPFHAPTNRSTQ